MGLTWTMIEFRKTYYMQWWIKTNEKVTGLGFLCSSPATKLCYVSDCQSYVPDNFGDELSAGTTERAGDQVFFAHFAYV